MDIVIDTCSIVRLAKGGVIENLNKVFDTVYIPQAVYDECSKHKPTKKYLKQFVFTVKPIKTLLPIKLGLGEKECVSLTYELNIDLIVTDDKKAIYKAKTYNLKYLTSFNIILIFKKINLIHSVKNTLDTMISKGEGITKSSYEKMLKKSNEL